MSHINGLTTIFSVLVERASVGVGARGVRQRPGAHRRRRRLLVRIWFGYPYYSYVLLYLYSLDFCNWIMNDINWKIQSLSKHCDICISSLSISSPGSVTNLDIMLPGPPPKPKKQKKLSVASSSYDQVGREKSQRSCYVRWGASIDDVRANEFDELQGDPIGCCTGNGEKVSSSQAEPGEAINSAVV